jgi:hypothetical protein
MRHLLLAVAVAAALLPAGARADDASYKASVTRALELTVRAQEGNPAAARQAATELKRGTGETQPEILADLSGDPPDLDDAVKRLRALSAALDSPAETTDPADAHRQLDSVLADPHYASLRAPKNPIEQLIDWLFQRLFTLLEGGISGNALVNLLLIAAGALVVGGVATWLIVALRGRTRREAVVAGADVRARQAVDHFAEADRLAAEGQLGGAVRELAAAVAIRLGGDDAWDASPLTVRELFKRAPTPQSLRPLLFAFERAAYAGRLPDPVAYASAAAAAEPYRVRSAAA